MENIDFSLVEWSRAQFANDRRTSHNHGCSNFSCPLWKRNNHISRHNRANCKLTVYDLCQEYWETLFKIQSYECIDPNNWTNCSNNRSSNGF